MLEKGGFSFVALLVINPMVILLYQNCSFLPMAQGEVAAREFAAPQRGIASVVTPQKVELKKSTTSSKLTQCKENAESCPSSHVE